MPLPVCARPYRSDGSSLRIIWPLEDLRRKPQARPESTPASEDSALPALVRRQRDMLDGQPLH